MVKTWDMGLWETWDFGGHGGLPKYVVSHNSLEIVGTKRYVASPPAQVIESRRSQNLNTGGERSQLYP